VSAKAKVELMSFGFKYGAPATNFYFDVTFLPNPARISGKQLFDELDDEMIHFVLQNESTQRLIEKIIDLTSFLVGFDSIKVGIGCNSGRHRSVIIVNEVSQKLNLMGIDNHVSHRELN
jgi:UPF0042 nucleotide-binding protein